MRLALALLGLCTAMACVAAAATEPKTPEAIERQYDQEKSARKRAELAQELMSDRLEQLHSLIQSGTILQESAPELDRYAAAAERLDAAVREASHNGTSKQSEMFLRSQLRDLDNLQMDLSGAERAILDGVIQRVSKLRDKILYSIMMPGKESANK